eukprot:m.61399 g.61399  ORF g.61399 m.61399 type:complete len:309 (+) comp12345_c0_seq1:427-1353(+)
MACNKCSAPAELKCARCHRVFYCGAACQKVDWPAHKPTCNSKDKKTVGKPPSKFSPLTGPLRGIFAQEADCDNLVIFLHGFGETEKTFHALGQKMAMPNTAVLALRGPSPVLDLGFSWFPLLDEQGNPIRESPSEKRRLQGLSQSVSKLQLVIEDLVQRGWSRKHIFLVGFAQGGAVALDCALSSPQLLGGAVSVSGGCFLPESGPTVSTSRQWKQRGVPLLITHGAHDPSLRVETVAAQVDIVKAFVTLAEVQFRTYPKADARISSAEEARDFFAFLAPLFASRMAAMEALAKDGTLIELTPKKPST